jgi:hypothetical protein
VHFVTKLSWLFWNLYRRRILLIPIMNIFDEKTILGLLGLGLKFEVAFGIYFSWPIFIIFWNWTLKCNKKLFHWLRNAKQLNIRNLTKVNVIHETKQEKNYGRNEILLLKKQNEKKRNEISLFFCFALFRVSRNKKRMWNGNPNAYEHRSINFRVITTSHNYVKLSERKTAF